MLSKSLKDNAMSHGAGVNVTVKELIALRYKASYNQTRDKNKTLSTPGQRLVLSPGRGIEFAATREYQHGDDIRAMAWRITARSMKPHIKIYQEEKERPVWLAVDLSPNLFFGTRRCFKSVASIKQASLLGWKYLFQHERVGAIIAAEATPSVYQPQASERNFLGILTALSTHSHLAADYNGQSYLQALLITMQQRIRVGNLIYIFSDFAEFTSENQNIIAHIARRAQVELVFVYDPFEAETPPPHQYKVTNGTQELLFNMRNAQCREQYKQQFIERKNHLIHFAQKANVAFHTICTAHED